MFGKSTRKPTDTDLDFNSRHPLCHKRSAVSTLLRRALNIPSTQKGKRGETKRVKVVLRDNNYPSSGFIKSCERSLSKLPTDLPDNGFVIMAILCAGNFVKHDDAKDRKRKCCLASLFVNFVKDKSNLQATKTEVAFKPFTTVNSLFLRQKVQEKIDQSQSGTVYKINCTNCILYYCQTE